MSPELIEQLRRADSPIGETLAALGQASEVLAMEWQQHGQLLASTAHLMHGHLAFLEESGKLLALGATLREMAEMTDRAVANPRGNSMTAQTTDMKQTYTRILGELADGTGLSW